MSSKSKRPTAEMFQPLVDNEFTVHVDEQTHVSVKLVEVKRLPPATTREDLPIRKDPFSMVFKLEGDAQLEQRIYSVEHPSQKPLELFLVPIGFGEYEAIFN